MARVIDFPKGLTFHTDQTKSAFFKDFKKNLRILGVTYYDLCCGDTVPLFQTFNTPALTKRVAVAANVTQTLSAGPFTNGFYTSTSAAAVSLTLPTATALATALGASRGSTFEFIIDNTAGSNTVTVVVNTGITLPGTVVITDSNTLTVAAANVGVFKLVFTSGTAAKIFRTS